TAPADIPTGLGKLTTVGMTREICSWARFTNRRAISSYTGLCPGEHSSGSKRVPGSVTKRGNPRLRAALVECAWRLLPSRPQYPPVPLKGFGLVQGFGTRFLDASCKTTKPMTPPHLQSTAAPHSAR